MSEEHGHERRHGHAHDGGHDHDHDGGHGHGHDHALIVDRLPPGDWRVDPHGSELLFKARAFGVLPVTGIFETFAGGLSADPAGAVSGRLTIETGSLNSGWARRDHRLRGPGYFDADRHPEMTFTLERIVPSGADHLNVSGTLRLRERPVELELPVYAIAHGDHLHLEGQAMVDYDLAGLGWARPAFIAGRVRAEAALTLVRS